ncbi:MAG TPA: type IV pilin N-terminal domain-containing protein [Methanospirillum sp.]|uniref:type IV pilin N-terminal domain-containing protein n=1 Tax=Methanospirillum sp. TaxID=45200 RepID=UPI001BD4DA76|nr:type IV pilin N-terminal domain-containing protein [Methanospirillum sp.]HPY61321.1 type IV pilin N-terminal domain-containing protein [Methanospirillum sp.]HQB99881.1 type IV pilin N-terminal domain-containing protein [Methanospirillum sp.]
MMKKILKILTLKEKNREPAVSPVVGIMLMITITLILAAIISGMTGGITQKQEKPPQLLIEPSVFINSTGSEGFLDIRVVSVSQGIPTRDLKLITEWRGNGKPYRTVITPLSKNVDNQYTYPVGYDPGKSTQQDFGNFTLLGGTRLNANSSAEEEEKNMDAVLENWKGIGDGTPVRIQFIHVPSGAIIADKEVTAEAVSNE